MIGILYKGCVYLNYNDFLKQVKNNTIDSSYLFYGEEEYLINECIGMLKNNYVDKSFEELNIATIEGREASFDKLMNACETLPFMSQKKIVLLNDVHIFFEREESTAGLDIYKYLDTLGSHVCLILIDNLGELKKTSKLYKFYNKKNLAVEFLKLRGKDLNFWIEDKLKKYNKKISQANINYLIQRSTYHSRNINSNLYYLENEIIKTISFSKADEVTKEDIDFVLAKSLDSNIFDLLSAVNRGDVDSSLSIFNEIYLSNEPIQKILFMITRQIRLILTYNIYKQRGYGERDIQEKLGVKPYEFSKISSQSKGFKIAELENSLNRILEVDKKVKTTSSNDKIEMEILLVSLSTKK